MNSQVASTVVGRVAIPDAEFYYMERVPLGDQPRVLPARLIDEVAWRAESNASEIG
jgi:hypothetical protein